MSTAPVTWAALLLHALDGNRGTRKDSASMDIKRSVSRWLAATAAVALILGDDLGAVIVSTQYVSINAGPADFGGPTHLLGGPQDDAVVIWDYATSSGQVVATARVRGTLYWDDLFSSGCTRLTIRFRNESDANLAIRTREVCGPGGIASLAANKLAIDESFSSTTLTRVRIDTARTSAGPAAGGFRVRFAPLSRDYEANMSGGLAHCGPEFGYWFYYERCVVGFNRNDGTMQGFVTGQLWVDFDRSNTCARAIVNYRTATGTLIDGTVRDTCNSRILAESLESGSLFGIRLHVGELSGGVFRNGQVKTFDFNGSTGDFTVEDEPVVEVHEQFDYPFIWTVPEFSNWHDLETLEFRIRDQTRTLLRVRFDEATRAFSVFNEASGRYGRAFPAGSPVRLQSSFATLHLAGTSVAAVNSVLGNGPDSPSVRINLRLSVKPAVAGRTLAVDLAATDDSGNEDPFGFAGTLTVTD